MQYTHLHETELMVSRICLGCMGFGERSYLPWALDELEARRVIAQALDCGINFFDTADVYSDGRSEDILGRVLRETSQKGLIIATKCGCILGGRGRNLTGAHILRSCDLSLKRLGVETIDLYQIHRLDGVTPLEESLSAFDKLVRSGRVRHVGISSVTPQELDSLLTSLPPFDFNISTIQNHYNLLSRNDEECIIPSCRKAGISIIPYSPLARGLLARSDSALTPRFITDKFAQSTYSPSSLAQTLRAVDTIADRRNLTRGDISLAWLLSKPFVSSCVIGATTTSQVAAASRASSLFLTASEMRILDNISGTEQSATA